MTLLQLHYINEICKCGSINKTAQKLFISQSSLSSSIQELEDELGITIFKRSNRGITLTEDGAEFIRHIEPIISQYKLIKDIYSDKGRISTPILSVSSQRYPFCSMAFVEFISKHKCDKSQYSLKEMGMYKVIMDVSGMLSEIGIVAVNDTKIKFMKKIFSSYSVEYVELIKVAPRVFLRKDHPLAAKEGISINDLSDYPYIIYVDNESASINFSEEALTQETFSFDRVIYVNDRSTCYNVLAHTDACTTGTGILPDGFCDSMITSVPLTDDLGQIGIGYIKLADADLSSNANEFIEILKKTLYEQAHDY